jgi:type I restriction enzyme S subunit
MSSDVLIFGDCANLVRASTMPSLFPDTPYIALEHIEQGSLSLNGHGFGKDADSQKTKFSKGDILFGKLRPYFRKAVIAPFDGLCSTHIWAVRPQQGIDRNFLFYWMASEDFVNRATDMSEGTRMPRAKWDIVSKFQIPKISFDEQVEIGKILRSLDDRITLLRETNATLEAIAQALFKSWFVDFDPVHAKQQGRLPEGMDEQTAALFPDSFEESELGLVPLGWEFSTIQESFILTMGQSPPGHTYNESGEGIPFYQGRTDFGFRFPSQRIFCTSPTRYAEIGDVLVSVRAPVGDVNMALEKCCLGRGVAGLKHPKGYKSFAFYTARGLRTRFDLFDSEGTVFGSINKKDFQELPVIQPTPDVMQVFDEIASPLDSKIIANERQIRTLTDLRDTLLPRLISGQLRVSDVEELTT